jgi:hypothetical protein
MRSIRPSAFAMATSLALLVMAQGARAESLSGYGLNWSIASDGGGTSAGGAFSVTGTIGQWDAGITSAGLWVLKGGVWSDVTQPTGVPPASEVIPQAFRLYAPRPNPFAGGTVIAMDLPSASRVSAKVYDVAGHFVRDLYDGAAVAGRLELRWNVASSGGRSAPAGIYFIRVSAGSHVATSKVVLLSEGGAR